MFQQGDIVVFSNDTTKTLRLGQLERYFASRREWFVSSDSFLATNDFTVHPDDLQKPLDIGATIKFHITVNGELHSLRGNIIGINITGSKENYEPHYLVESFVGKHIYHVSPRNIEKGLSEETRRVHRRMLSLPLGLNRRSKTRSKAVSSLSLSSNSSHRKSRSKSKEKRS